MSLLTLSQLSQKKPKRTYILIWFSNDKNAPKVFFLIFDVKFWIAA